MRPWTLLKRNLTYYWRTHIAVAFGVATAVAVLAGALLVGDSVRASLRELFVGRLGSTDVVVAAPGYLREGLAGDLVAEPRFRSEIRAACPLVALPGVAVHAASGRRASRVAVYGVDERFWKFHGVADRFSTAAQNDALVTASLAAQLGARSQEYIVLRLGSPPTTPGEWLHGRRDELGPALRLAIREILPPSGLGEFSLRPEQGDVRAIFVPLGRLQRDLKKEGRVNTILISTNRPDPAPAALEAILRQAVSLEDLGVRVRILKEQGAFAVESDRILVEDPLAAAAQVAARKLDLRAEPVLTYLANTIRLGLREIPYSLVAAVDFDANADLRRSVQTSRFARARTTALPPILLNAWAAQNLGAKPGDTLTLEYFVWGDAQLETRSAQFQLSGIVPMKGGAADPDFAPRYPGITDAEALGDWDPPFAIDLRRVRPRDEDYWRRYRTTPKAFVPLETGRKLWGSRFGSLTSVRVFPRGAAPLEETFATYRKNLRSQLDPLQLGLSVQPVRAQGLEAARGATDFGEYFAYFSSFLVFSAILLTVLFFRLGVEQRLREIGILQAVGFSATKIRSFFLLEGFVIAALGGLIGLVGAVAFAGLMMLGLRTWWADALATTRLELHVTPGALAYGALGGVASALLGVAWTLRELRRITPRSLLTGTEIFTRRRPREARAAVRTGTVVVAAALLLLVAATMKWVGQVAGFFGAGILLLLAFLCYERGWLSRAGRRLLEGHGLSSVLRLGFRNAGYRPGRSSVGIALVAFATFVIVSVDAVRLDTGGSAFDPKSGSGGFPLLAESLLPIHSDPNSPAGRENLNLVDPGFATLHQIHFVRFRLRPGDDASCLNLYRPRTPTVLGAPPDLIRAGRFSFQDSLARTPEEKANPWLLLEASGPDRVVPAIADADSMTYVLHLKLGDELVVNADTGERVRLKLVGALEDSVFQSELLVAEKDFLRVFPRSEGYRLFLIDAPPQTVSEVTRLLESGLAEYGLDVTRTDKRLAAFHRVRNTYISTFQTLGALGLLLGTVGLAAVLLRNVLERRRELALLRAVGYRPRDFAVMVVAENLLLLLLGLASGTAAALLAIAPALLAEGGHPRIVSLGVFLFGVFLSGLAASTLATLKVIRSPLLPALRAE